MKTNIILGILIALEILFLLNFKIVVGMGASMEPTINGNRILLCKYGKDYKVGDIVLYKIDGFPIIHRITNVDIYDQGDGRIVRTYTLKGDNNEKADGFLVYKENIIYKVLGY